MWVSLRSFLIATQAGSPDAQRRALWYTGSRWWSMYCELVHYTGAVQSILGRRATQTRCRAVQVNSPWWLCLRLERIVRHLSPRAAVSSVWEWKQSISLTCTPKCLITLEDFISVPFITIDGWLEVSWVLCLFCCIQKWIYPDFSRSYGRFSCAPLFRCRSILNCRSSIARCGEVNSWSTASSSR